ncbi:MAG: DNA translocase FtsK, partial [Oscillospiraceae bacterium]|nr:DNA translocase FtsK [Oscillospiraceae bacterium]
MASTKKSAAKSPRASAGGKGSGKQASRPVRREVGAAVCLLLAFFAAFGYFDIHALFIDFFVGLLKGLLGYGFWAAPPALLAAGLILAFHRGRPVALRLCCALLLPLGLGSVLHLILLKDLPGAASLWATGRAMESGGLFSGLLALGLVCLFSRVGAMAILIVAALLMAAAVFNFSFKKVIQAFRSRPRYEPEEEPERPQAPARARQRRAREKPAKQERIEAREDTGELPRPPERRAHSADID